jgi:hypothetical protein
VAGFSVSRHPIEAWLLTSQSLHVHFCLHTHLILSNFQVPGKIQHILCTGNLCGQIIFLGLFSSLSFCSSGKQHQYAIVFKREIKMVNERVEVDHLERNFDASHTQVATRSTT